MFNKIIEFINILINLAKIFKIVRINFFILKLLNELIFSILFLLLFGLFTLMTLASIYWTNGEAALKRFYAADIAFHMILPTFTVTLVAFAGTALLTRTTMMEVLKDDYILTARAKGLSQKRIRDRHAARTALLPVVTSFIFTIITIIDGSVLTESIFSWPGMGQLILEAVVQEDIPLAMASFSFIGILALIAHFIADISYAFLDPRIRIKSEN